MLLGLRKEPTFFCVLVLVVIGVCECGITNAKPLKLLIPLKPGFNQFVAWERTSPDNRLYFSGFCVDVFRRCVAKLPYKLDYELVGFGDGVHDPVYNDMVAMLVSKEADGIVADITITEERMMWVEFTQPYLQSSFVMVVPFRYAGAGRFWTFLQPFRTELWASIAATFVSTAVVIYVLEYENPLFHGEDMDWRTRISNVFWFTSMTLFFCQSISKELQLNR